MSDITIYWRGWTEKQLASYQQNQGSSNHCGKYAAASVLNLLYDTSLTGDSLVDWLNGRCLKGTPRYTIFGNNNGSFVFQAANLIRKLGQLNGLVPSVRSSRGTLKSLMKNAKAVAHLSLRQGIWEEGDPGNRLIQLKFDRYKGRDVHAKLDAMVSSLFGSEDSIKYIKHNAALEIESEKAKAKLPALRKDFNAGLQPGELIQVKAPFPVPGGGSEWMWVEVSKWKGNAIEGLLKNEPFNIPALHAGQIVKVNQQDVFDYIRRYPDGREIGNKTAEIISKMRSQ